MRQPNDEKYLCGVFPAERGAKTIACPVCGGPTRERRSAAGPFAGCVDWPRCRGSVDLGGPPGEHPVVRTRRLALRWLATRARRWSEEEHHDAVGDVLVAALRGGWAARPEAWGFVARKALRALSGITLQRNARGEVVGRRVHCRTCPGSTATRAMPSPQKADGAGREPLPPGDWLDATGRAARRTDPEAALDTARWCGEMQAWGLDLDDDAASTRLALDLLRDWDAAALADEVGVRRHTIHNWRATGAHARTPRPEHAARLVDLAQARLAGCP